MMRFVLIFTLALLAAGGARLHAAEVPIPPSPTRYVTDTAGFISESTRAQLDAKLEDYARANGHQILVYIGQSTGDTPIEDWGVKAFERWKPGRKGLDDGLALFIMAQDRKVRIEVGYGLESTVTDAVSSQIIQEIMDPRIRAGDRDGAVVGAVNALLGAIGGAQPSAQAPRIVRGPSHPHSPPVGGLVQIVFLLIGAVFLIVLFITNPSLALFLLYMLMSGGRGGGGGGGFSGGGGGFSGGGGSSGGGGATGSW